MKKEIPCLDCRGQGFISKFNEKSAWLERCPNCGGTGVITVVVTNADRIRAMSDEELAVFLESKRGCPTDDDCEYGVYATPKNCIKHWATWLQSPTEEDA